MPPARLGTVDRLGKIHVADEVNAVSLCCHVGPRSLTAGALLLCRQQLASSQACMAVAMYLSCTTMLLCWHNGKATYRNLSSRCLKAWPM
jgi:hypothetical protein